MGAVCKGGESSASQKPSGRKPGSGPVSLHCIGPKSSGSYIIKKGMEAQSSRLQADQILITTRASISLFQIIGDAVFQVSIATVDCAAQGSFGGSAIAKALQNALDVAHAVGVADVFNTGQSFIVGHVGLPIREAHPRAFKGAERNLAMLRVDVCELPAYRRSALRLQCLGNAFIEPLRTAPVRDLVNKCVCQLVLEHTGEFGGYAGQAVYGYT